ncbi:MAG: LytTR family DNA-binding domain-containing protein [Defluviitaleaceae bacterium]|nr:LytTR family DNA-binding domain-containing protein [Defluviitaleaceae bacterium]
MISIFICDDDALFLAQVKSCVKTCALIENFAMSIVMATKNPDEILDFLKNNRETAGIYFLDLDLSRDDITGMQLAQKIRKYDPWGVIIFITSDAESHKLTFEYATEASDYIIKGSAEFEARIHKCLQGANAKFTAKRKTPDDKFIVNISKDLTSAVGASRLSKGSTIPIDQRKIMYLVTNPEIKNGVVMYTDTERIEFRGSLTQIEKLLNKKLFLRFQRNIIVNLQNISAVHKETLMVLFKNGLELEVNEKQAHKLSHAVRKRRG